LVLALQNSFFVPIELSFEPPFTKLTMYLLLNIIVDLVFFLDMIVMSITTYTDRLGREVKDSHMIFLKYLKSFRFYPDLISLFGNDLLTALFPIFKICGLFKVIRVLRLG